MTVFVIAYMMLLCGCPPTPSPDPGPNPPPQPPQPPPAASCSGACLHARELGCSWAQPTPKGATCETVCNAAQALEPWNLACRSSAASCAAVEGCEK